MTDQERRRETKWMSGENPGQHNEEGQREQRATACRCLGEDRGQQAALSADKAPGEGDTPQSQTNRLPSALVAVPSLSKLKNKGRDNREQLVTFKKLKSRMLLATKKAKAQFEIKLRRKQTEQQSRV